MDCLTGVEKLAFLRAFMMKTQSSDNQELYCDIFKELIDENLPLIEETQSEESAYLILNRGTFYLLDELLAKAEQFADKGIILARQLGRSEFEVHGLALKGQIYGKCGQHVREMTFLQRALEKSKPPLNFTLHALIAQSHSKTGNYYEALNNFDKCIALCDEYLDNPQISDSERRLHTMCKIENMTWKAAVLVLIGDMDAANMTFAEAVNLAATHKCFNEMYHQLITYSIKLLISSGNYDAAERYLTHVSKSHIPAEYEITFAKDWAVLYQESKRYSQAIEKYHECFFGRLRDESKEKDHITKLMETSPEYFMGLMSMLLNCLTEADMIKQAQKLSIAIQTFNEIIKESSWLSRAVVEIKKAGTLNILKSLFQDRPDRAIYKDIVAEYDSSCNTVFVHKGPKRIAQFRSRRGFLTIKYFFDNPGKCITRENICKYWADHSEGGHDEVFSMNQVKAYIDRFIRRKLKLGPYLKAVKNNQDNEGGWILEGP